jgi:hypothetical protein
VIGTRATCALLSAGLGLWLIPVHGTRAAAAITLGSFIAYFLGMAAVVKPVLPGPVTSLRPVLPILGLGIGPLLVLVGPSVSTRLTVSALLAVLAVRDTLVAFRRCRSPY